MRSIPRPFWLIFAFLLACGVRLYGLGTLPLNEEEARLALQAWKIAQGMRVPLDSQVLYLHPTAALFFLFGPQDFMARFWPALSGSLLVLLPWLWRRQLGERTALIFAFFLALDPGMVALSRQANAWMPALLSLALCVTAWKRQRYAWGGFFAALVLLAGLPSWEGLFLLVVSLGLYTFLEKPIWLPLKIEAIREAFLPFLLTLLLGGTLFFTSPAGFGAIWNAPLELWRSWITLRAPLSQMFLVWIGYELFPSLLAISAFLFRNAERKWLIPLGVTFLIPLLFPGRAPVSWLWFLGILLFLAAHATEQWLQHFSSHHPLVFAEIVSFLLMLFIALNLVGIANNPYHPINSQPLKTEIALPFLQTTWTLPLLPLRWMAILGAVLLLVAGMSLIGLEWGWKATGRALTLSFGLLLSLYTLGSTWSASGLRIQDGTELWSVSWAPPQGRLLEQSLGELSLWRSGHRQGEHVLLAGWAEPPAALEWLLRRYSPEFSQGISPSTLDGSYALVITPQTPPEIMPIPYRGQDFLAFSRPRLPIGAPEVIQWLFFRRLPLEHEHIILWVRSDLFDYKTTPPGR